MEKRKKIELGANSKKYWHSFYWATSTLEQYFEGKLHSSEKKDVENQLNAIADNVLKKKRLTLSETELEKADRTIKRNVFRKLQLPLMPFPQKRNIFGVSLRTIKYATVAAALLLLIGFSYWQLRPESYFRQQYMAWSVEPELLLHTTGKEHSSITLSDGTKVYLNGNSRLSYKAGAFNKNEREVWLEGEAFFEVAKNPKKPFIIHSPGEMQTKVLGTSFDVKAYPELSEQVVSVRTGKVKVSKSDGEFVQITPNLKAVFNKKANTLTTGSTDGELAASWRNGNIVFDHADKEEIRLRIHQQFGKEVIIKNDALSDVHFIASYPAEATLEQIVKTIALTNNVQYSIDKNQVIFK